MKKLLVTMLTILTCGAAYALPVGNPADASLLCDGLIWEGHCGDPCDPCLSWCDAFSVRIGFYGDYVFDRHLRAANDDRDLIEHSRINTNAGFIALNLWDRLDVFTTLGATHMDLETNAISLGPIAVGRLEVETDTRFSWSVGARGTLWECGCTSLGIEGQYFSTNPHLNRITFDSVTSLYPNDIDFEYREWQVGLGIAHRINMFVPYVAVKWSHAKINLDDADVVTTGGFIDTRGLRNNKHWGWAVGVSLVDCEKASLTVEGRFADEKAVYVNGQVRF